MTSLEAFDPNASERESRRWAMLAHLSVFAYAVVPFGGLFAAGLIYALRRDDTPIARENQRHALNFEITMAILYVISIVAYVGASLAFVYALPAPERGRDVASAAAFAQFGRIFAIASGALLLALGFAVMAGVGAYRAWHGRVFRYVVAFPFVRPPAAVVRP